MIFHRFPGLGPFLFFYPVVLLAALLGGMWAGISATVLSSLLADYFIFEPVGRFGINSPSDDINLAVFTVFGIFLSLVIEKHRRYREDLAAARAEAAVAEERRKAEEERKKAALVESERQRLFEILEALPAMTCLLTPEHKVVFANRTFRERFGEPDGRRCHELCFEQANPCEFCEGFEPLETGNAHRWELKAPGDRVLDSYVMPFTDADGSRLILKVDTDITEQKRAQAELKQHRDHLEDLVQQRTRELEKTNAKLEADIALRKRVEAALRASEDRFRIALRNAPVSLAVQDSSLKYVWAYNQKTAPQDGIIGKSDAEIFTAEEAAHITEIKKRILREGCELREQMWFERPDSRIFLDVTYSPVRDESGNVMGVASATVDLTATKTSEEQLRLSEEKFARAFADNPSAIALVRLEDLVFVDVNETLISISGYSREEMIGHSAFKLNMWPSLEDAERLKSKLQTDGSLRGVEQAFRKKSGELVVTNLSAQFLEINGESLVLAAAVDVSKAKRAEEALAGAKAEAERSAAQLKTIFDTVDDLLYVYDSEGNPIVANHGWRNIFSNEDGSMMTVQEMEKKVQSFDLDGNALPSEKRPAWRVMRGEKISGVQIKVRFLETGEERIISCSGAPVRDADGRITMAVLSSTDITEQKKAELEIAKARREWERTFDTIPDLVAILDDQHRVVRMNRAMAERLAVDPEAGCGQNCFTCVHGTSAPPADCPHVQTLRDGHEHSAEVDEPRLGGSFLVTTTPLIGDDGKMEGAVHVARDITERKKAEKVLQTTLQRFYTILSNLHSAILLVTDEGWTEFANQAFCDYYGLSGTPADQIGVDAPVMHERIKGAYDDPDRASQRIREIVAGGVPVLDEEILMRNGRTFLRDFIPLNVDGKSYGRLWAHRDITERKRAEEALRESLERLERVLEVETVGVMFWDLSSGRLVDANDTFLKLMGYSRSDIEAQELTWQKFTPPEYHDVSLREIEKFQATGRVGPYEKEYFCKDGTKRWLLFAGSSLGGNQCVEFCADISARKEMEDALRESERQFHDLAQEIPQLAWMTNPDGWIYWYNRRWYEYTGTTPEEMEGWGWQSVHDPNELPRIIERWKAALASGEPWEDTFPLRGADGVFRPFLSRAFPLRDAEGRITHWFGTNTDVSDMKRAEEALRRHAELLQLSFDAVILWRLDGAIESWNAGAERLYGYTEDEAVGRVTHELLATVFPIPWPEIRSEIREGFWEGELHHRTRDGREIIVSSRHQLIRGADGIERILEINRDITERKRAEEQIVKLNRTLRALSRSSQAILRATDEAGYLNDVCEIIIEDCGHEMVWIGLAEHDEKKSVRVLASAGHVAGYTERLHVTWGEDERGQGPTGQSIRSGKPVICQNMLTDPAFAPWRKGAIERGYASVIAVPFKMGDQDWGEFSIYSRERDAFSEAEVELLTELASDVEFGIQSLRLRAAHDHAQKELMRSREVLALFIENAPVAMAMFDRKMRYLHASRRWRIEYGLGDRELTGVSHYEVFPELSEEWKEAHRRGLAGESLSADGDRFERSDGTRQWIRWEIRPWYEAGGSVGGILLLTEDITRRREAEEALTESEVRFRTLADALPQLVWMANTQGVVEYYNARYREYGITASADAGYDWEQTIHPDDRGQTRNAWEEAVARGTTYQQEHRMLIADGSYRWHLNRGIPQLDESGAIVRWIGTATDIEDLKQAEAALLESERLTLQRKQLRALAEHQEKAREEERTRVARDLHDDIGQILTAVKMELVWIGRRTKERKGEVVDRLNSSVKLINEGVQSVRRICSGLRPPVLDDLGLAAAVEWQANDFAKRTGIGCRLSLPSDTLDIDGDQRTTCFRIFQECLTNISRHAHAETVDVSLSPLGKDLVLIVRDDGKGFREGARTTSLGLLGMRERAQVCGGELTIDSSPGKGTAVTLRIPRRRGRTTEENDAHSDRG
jgi:PAS domain S-box-containing protein